VTTPRQVVHTASELRQTQAKRVDRVTQADRLFVDRRPDRQHPFRLASQAEINQQKLFDSKPPPIPSGCRLFTVVRGISPDARMCPYLPNLEDARTDLSGGVARRIFSSHTPEIDARLRVDVGVRS